MKHALGNLMKMQILSQLIGGMISGLIGFLSAFALYKYQEKSKEKQEIKNLLFQLSLESKYNQLYSSTLKAKEIEQDQLLFHHFSFLNDEIWKRVSLTNFLGLGGVVHKEVGLAYYKLNSYNSFIKQYHLAVEGCVRERKTDNFQYLYNVIDKLNYELECLSYHFEIAYILIDEVIEEL